MKRPKKDKNLNRGISVTISQKSSDKVIGALVDIFSPVSQSLGLLGDRINTYRQQQEITALKMLREAKRIAKEKNVVLELPPPKFMLPYMDSASIEDGEDEEIRKKYANLLVSAGQQMDSFVYFARTLLSELAPDEAKLLDYLVETSGVLKFATAREYNLAVEKNLDSARMEISTIVGRSRNAEMDREAALQAMIDAFSGKENAIFAGWSFNAKGTPFDGGDGVGQFTNTMYSDSYARLLILEGRQIVKSIDRGPKSLFDDVLGITHVAFTGLGFSVMRKLY